MMRRLLRLWVVSPSHPRLRFSETRLFPFSLRDKMKVLVLAVDRLRPKRAERSQLVEPGLCRKVADRSCPFLDAFPIYL